MRSLSIVTCLAAGLSSGCFSPTVPGEETDANTGTQTSTGATTDEDTPTPDTSATQPGTETADDGSSTSSDPDTDGPSGPPSIELQLDGSDEPEAITDHTLALLTAEVQADAGVVQVEFFANDVLLGTDTDPPFEFSDPLASDDSGLRTYRAVVVDGASATAEDMVEVSVNIAGGNVEALENLGFTGALQARSVAVLAGGAVSTHEGSVFLSAISDTGGLVSEFLSSQATGFEVQWTREFANGVKSPVSAVGDELAVAVTAGGNWTVQLLDPGTGQTNDAWTLGSAPNGDFFGPQIASTGTALFGTTSQSSISRFDSEGTADRWTEMTEVGAVFELATSEEDVLVSFGDIFADAPSSCATSSSYCLQKVTGAGSLQWVTGLSEQFSLNHRLAAHPAGGAYAVSFVSEGARGNGFEVTRVSADGAILSQEHFGSAGSDDRADRAFDIDVSPDGSLVVCGTGSKVEDSTVFQIPFVIRFDANLEVIWDARDFLVDGGAGYGIACAVADDAVAIYGLSDVAGGETGGEDAILGTPWLARISL